jgi:hypothetical protein
MRSPQASPTVTPLCKVNRHPRDASVQFDEPTHIYVVSREYGVAEQAPVSVTGFAAEYFSKFDGPAIVDRYYFRWKADASSKYYSIIVDALQRGQGDEGAREAILALWAARGSEASQAGTLMHARCEELCNGMLLGEPTPEVRSLQRWLDTFEPHMQWKPFRTEWVLWYEVEDRGPLLLAGTLDLLMYSAKEHKYMLVDFKRVDPKPKYTGGPPRLLGPHTGRFHPGFATGPLTGIEDSDFGKYTVQLNVYAFILRERYGIDVESRMLLLQLHPALEEAHCVQVPQVTQEVDALFAEQSKRRVGI